MPIHVVITVYADKSFSFVTKTPPASFFIKKAAGLAKGSATPGRKVVASISMAQVREIAEKKMVDLNANDLEQASKMIAGSARSMGVEVRG
jgi:large subunit ribosomal protein L11